MKQIAHPKRKIGFQSSRLSVHHGQGKGYGVVSEEEHDIRARRFDRRTVQLSVVSEGGREATLGILGEGDFFGEGGLAGQLLRMSSATAMTDCVLLHIRR